MAVMEADDKFPFENLTLAEVLTSRFLTCNQCEKIYDRPILLPCLHCLCSTCVQALINDKERTATSDTKGETDDDKIEEQKTLETNSANLKSLGSIIKNGDCLQENGQSHTKKSPRAKSIDSKRKHKQTQKEKNRDYLEWIAQSKNDLMEKIAKARELDTKEDGSDSASVRSDTDSSSSGPTDPDPDQLLQIQCPVCQSFMESCRSGLERVDNFMENLAQVLSYKTDLTKVCDYCSYNGKRCQATTLCLECQDVMCNACLDAHQRIRVTRDHTIAPFQQIQKGLYDHNIREHQSVTCRVHKKNTSEWFCETCTEVICTDCKAEGHPKHNVIPISKSISKYNEQLKSFLEGLKRRLTVIKDYSAFLENIQKESTRAKDEAVKEINNQAERLHQLIDDQKQSYIAQLSSACDEQDEEIDSKSQDLSSAYKSLVGNCEFLSHLIKFAKSDEILISHDKIIKRLKQLVAMHPDGLDSKLVVNFQPGAFSENEVQQIFGSLSTDKTLFEEEDNRLSRLTIAAILPPILTVPELVKSFSIKGNTDTQEIWPTGLLVTNKRYIIVDRDNKVVKILNKEGEIEVQFSGDGENVLGSPFDATILQNRDIAITDYKSEDVKIFDQSGNFVKSFSGHFRHPRGITTNSKGEILVVDCHKLRITTHDPNSGECIAVIEGKDDTNNKLLVDPYYIDTTENDNIIVSDHAAPNIKIFSPNGDYLAQYGTYGINQSQVLQPYGVCVDNHGYILVADHQNNRVHVLLPDGRFLKVLLTPESNVWKPVAIAVEDNHVVVAEALGKVKVWRYM